MDSFSKIYSTGKWGIGSGPGSYKENTVEYRAFLQNYILENNVQSIIDVGCGDWQIFKLLNLDQVIYTGYDCVSDVIKTNSELYASPNIWFECLDLTTCANRLEADLIIVKDVFQHLSFKNIFKIWSIIKNNTVLLVNDSIEKENKDIQDGGYRELNLEKEPFNLDPPLFVYSVKNSSHSIKHKSVHLIHPKGFN